MREIWEHHNHLIENTPNRTHEWGIESVSQEAREWKETNPVDDPEAFLHEGADVILSYMSAMKSAGFSYEVAMQAIMHKLNIVIDRAISVNLIKDGRSWEERYETIKAQEVELWKAE